MEFTLVFKHKITKAGMWKHSVLFTLVPFPKPCPSESQRLSLKISWSLGVSSYCYPTLALTRPYRVLEVLNLTLPTSEML